ncbi:MAG: nitrous oxide reductase family maturation protein NosD [Flavobacteriales bacterium]
MNSQKQSLIIGCFFFCFFVNAKTIEVCSSCENNDVKKAIENAQSFDTVFIKVGIYPVENIKIDKPITIIGERGATLDGKVKNEIFTIKSDRVSIINMTLQNSGRSNLKDLAAIHIEKGKNFIIKNNFIYDNYFGIIVNKGQGGVIENNVVRGYGGEHEFSIGNAIHLWYCKDIIIKNNEVSFHRDGIYFEFVDNTVIEANNSHHNIRYGLHFMFSNHDEYSRNTFTNNGAGVAVMFSKFIKMYYNKFEYNWGASSYGLLLKEINDSEIKHNIFFENTTGIQTEGANRISYVENTFEKNGFAMRVRGASIENKIIRNNFISNTFDMAFNGRFESNVIDSNYWSEYTGYDLDRDGVGDIPFHPVKLFSFITGEVPESIVLIRSLFVDLLNYSEKVAPVITPKEVADPKPSMTKIQWK